VTLAVVDLKVAYGAVQAVRGLDLRLEQGECVALLGPNGAGKTSSVEAIVGLLPKVGGKVLLRDVDITALPASAVVKKGLVLVPQWRELFANFSVEENLIAARSAAKDRLPKALEYVYGLFPMLKERRRQAAGLLSGGEQQMLAIGRALITSPSVLLLDEPSAGLSPLIVRSLINVLRRIRDEGVSLLLVEQKLEIMEAVSDRCIVLSAGNVVWQGPTKQAADLEEIRRAYFT
jgi:branched-chain amino acid transport system ATP-binding protein